MGKLIALLGLFRKGSAVADPSLWKDRYGKIMAISTLILLVVPFAKEYGYMLPIDEETAKFLAGVIVDAATAVAILAGILSNYTTSDKVGVLPPKPEDGAASK